MATDERHNAQAQMLETMCSLQKRLEQVHPILPSRAERLHDELRRVLLRANRAEVLQNPLYETTKLLKLVPAEKSRKVKELGGTHAILGGYKDTKRRAEPKEMFIRDDGARIHFSIIVKENPDKLELIAYDIELYHPSREPVWFVRFDMNQPGHTNEDLCLRSHIHPSHEDLLVPSPVLSPVEALSFLLYGFRLRRESTRGPGSHD